MGPKRLVYPFSAIVGQEKLKLALILNVVDPRIGGALLTGARGAGKSLVVNALADLLPEIEVVEGCPFNCNPRDPTNLCENCRSRLEREGFLPVERKRMQIIQLPIGATDESLIGTLDIEKAFREGIKALQPGLLARANQNILYIDQVNLLPDHLVDAILDAVASGWNIVQREEVSVTHPSRFVLIGSMDPTEGDLRPQILDRFSLHAGAENLTRRDQRVEVVKRNLSFEEDPAGFYEKYRAKQEELRRKIVAARELLPKVHVPRAICEVVARMCAELEVDGHRPDIVTIRAAKALAAFNGRTKVQLEDILITSELALSHRTRRSGLERPPTSEEIRRSLEQAFRSLGFSTGIIGTEMGYEVSLPMEIKVPEIGQIKIVSPPVKVPQMPPLRKIRRRIPLIILALLSYFILPFFLFFVLALAFLIYVFPPTFPSVIAETAEMPSVLLGWRGMYALTLATIGLALYLLYTHLRRQEAPTIYYVPYTSEIKGKLPRRIVSQIYGPAEGAKEIKELRGAPTYAIAADRGVVLSRTYRTLLGFGRKIASTVQELLKLMRGRLEFELLLEKSTGRPIRRTKTVVSAQRGRYVWFKLPEERPWDIALGPTIRAAAPYQPKRVPGKLALKIAPQDVRVKVREYRPPNVIVILLDMSESMAASLENVRKAILSLHRSAHRHRDKVGLVVFKGREAVILQHPTTNLNLVVRKLFEVGASDFTPIAAGLLKARRLLLLEKQKNKDVVPILVMISDGIANVPLERPLSPFTRQQFYNPSQADAIDVAHQLAKDHVRAIIINTDHRPEEVGMKRSVAEGAPVLQWYSPTDFLMEIAKITGGQYYGLKLA